MTMLLAVAIPAFAGTATAQKRDNRRSDRYNDQNYDPYFDEDYDDNAEYKRPNVYDRHRKAINLGVATGAGAILGAIFGGKKGALIGAAAGVATGAIITAKQKPRNTQRYFPY